MNEMIVTSEIIKYSIVGLDYIVSDFIKNTDKTHYLLIPIGKEFNDLKIVSFNEGEIDRLCIKVRTFEDTLRFLNLNKHNKQILSVGRLGWVNEDFINELLTQEILIKWV